VEPEDVDQRAAVVVEELDRAAGVAGTGAA
jgi:hypothetical protein